MSENLPASMPEKSKMRIRKDLLLAAFLFVVILVTGISIFFSPALDTGGGEVKIIVRKGETISQLASDLSKDKMIGSETLFRIACFITGADSRLKAGRYTLQHEMSYAALASLFASDNYEKAVVFDLYNGIPVKAVFNKLLMMKQTDSSEIRSLFSDSLFFASAGLKFPSDLEGAVLPGSYIIYPGENLRDIIRKGIDSMNNFMAVNYKNAKMPVNLTPYQVVILASIVQGETNLKREMPAVAGVYLNRLKKGIKLEADPTVQYALPGGKKKRLYFSDLLTDSPYNTYRYSGLPPGPINNPGRDAILSVLNPDSHNYLFFCASPTGGHKFAETYEDHLKNAKEYQAWLDSKNIK